MQNLDFNIVHQNLDLYCIQNLDLYRLPKPKFISNTKVFDINLGFGIRYKFRFWYTV
jgi:hypothetical protein